MTSFNFLARRPLFYAAILFCLIILSASHFTPKLFYQIQKNDVYWIARDKPNDVLIRGIIISEVEEKKSFYREAYETFVLRGQSIAVAEGEPRPVSGKIRVTLKNPPQNFQYGDEIRVRGRLVLPEKRRNPGGFDARAYLDRRGIRALLFSGKKPDVQISSRHRGNFFLEHSYRFRHYLSQNLSDNFRPVAAAFLKALMLGEKSDVSGEFEDLFIKTGTLHLLAVSGFNVGFLSAAVLFFLAPFPISKNLKWLIVLGMIWFYCLVVGWQAPLVRASVMATILICGNLIGRKTDFLNSLGLAAIFILAVNPKTLFDVGFQLSFLAVAGLALFVPVFMPKKELFPNEKLTMKEKVSLYTAELFWVSFVATFVTLPVTVQNFYLVTPLSLLANMIAVPLSFFLFFCTLVYFFTFWWVPKIVFFVPWILKSLMQIFIACLSWIGQLPFSCVTVGKLSAPLEILLIAGILYFFFSKKIKSRSIRALLIFIFSLNIFLLHDALRHGDRPFTMTALDVGQGDAIYFEFPQGGNLLIDAGKGEPQDKGRRVVVPYLRSKGIRSIDAMVVSHPQADHIGGMSSVLEEFSVKNVFDAKKFYSSRLYEDLKHHILKEGSRYQQLGRGMKVEGFKNIRIDVLNPSLEEESIKNINNACLVLKITYGETSFLLTGDIEAAAMKEMMEADLDLTADVLKVPHHGSKMNKVGEEFVDQAAPKFSVISVGERNPFGHPRAETLEALASIPGNIILRTDQQGAVCLVSDAINVTSAPTK